MADPLKRSQVLQQQIEDLRRTAPPPLTQTERDQIMKGRKGQKDIDAGRAAIAERERAIRDHADQVGKLTTKLDTAIAEEGAEATRKEREASADPMWNTYIPSGVGALAGAGIGEIENRLLHEFNRGNAEAIKGISKELGPVKNLTTSQLSRARAAGAATAAEKYAPSSSIRQGAAVAGRGLSYGVPAGIFYNEYTKYADRANNPGATEADKLANQRVANALLGVSTGIAADGGMRFFFPSRHEGEGEAMANINAAREYTRRMDAADRARSAPRPTPLTPAPANPPAQPQSRPALPGSKADLLQQAKRYNIKGRSKMSPDELRTAVGEAIASTKAPRGGAASKALKALGPVAGPAVAATVAYNAATSDAQARGESPTDASTVGEGLAAGGIAGGAAYGANRLLSAAPVVAGPLAATSVMGFDPLEGASYEDTAQNISAARGDVNAAMPWVGRNVLGVTPEEQSAYEMAQVPPPSPARVQRGNQGRQDAEYMRRYLADEPVNMPAGADAGWQDRAASAQPDDFDAQLAELQQIMAELEGPAESPQQARRPVVMPPPSMVSPALQNRLLAVR
jgi:hypothetical protein